MSEKVSGWLALAAGFSAVFFDALQVLAEALQAEAGVVGGSVLAAVGAWHAFRDKILALLGRD